jgi:hypothetical protein
MDIKIDINDAINKAIGVCTKFGEFWKGMVFPTNIGPALSYLIILGLLPFVGYLLIGIIPQPGPFGIWYSLGIGYGIVTAIVGYVFFLAMPILMGAILGAIDPALNINKGKAIEYTTVLAYAATPAAIGALLGWIPYLGWLLMLVFGVLSIIVTYLAFTEGVGMDSGQAIIMMVIMVVIYTIIYAIVFMVIINSIFSMGIGRYGY